MNIAIAEGGKSDYRVVKTVTEIFACCITEIEFVKFINPLGFSKAEEFEGLLSEIWVEVQRIIETL